MIINAKRQYILSTTGIMIIIVYILVRISSFWDAKAGIATLLYMVIFTAAEFFIAMHTLGFFLTIRRIAGQQLTNNNSPQEPVIPACENWPPVAVVVAARHEAAYILENTFTTLQSLNYPNKILYFLDDSTDEQYKAEAAAIADHFGAKLFRRQERHGAKAGIINDFLKTAEEKYLAVFDADQNPLPAFLFKTIAILESRPNVAFIQTPQFYTNLESGPVAVGAGMQQAVFYESICEGKAIHNAMFCCGTNVVFRTALLKETGGFDEGSITEDFSTSLEFHCRGYESFYYNHVAVFGMAPETLQAYFKQQMRWAAGTISILKTLIRKFIRNRGMLSPVQWWEYFLSGSYYFCGWMIFILMISPIISILTGMNTLCGNPTIYTGVFILYFFFALLLFFFTMRSRKYTFLQIYQGIILGYLSFPVLMIAAVKGLFFKKMIFSVTSKGRYDKLPVRLQLPYFFMIALSLTALFKYFHDFSPGDYTGIINIFWIIYHLFILLNFFHFNRKQPLNR